MDKTGEPSLGDALAAATGWWHEAGVDLDFVDEPLNWLAKPERDAPSENEVEGERAKAKTLITAPPPLGGERTAWPDTLDQFAGWWTTAINSSGAGPRVAPRGRSNAELMVLVPMPEPGDGDILLSGRQGELVTRMLAAMGIEGDAAYIAAALPCHVSHADWSALAARQLGEVLRLHIALASPKRLLVLGRKMLPLFGHDLAQGSPIAGQIGLQGVDVPVLAAVGPETLLEQPRFRKSLWRAWLDWTEGRV